MSGVISLCKSLLQFAVSVYADEAQLIDNVYDFVLELTKEAGM